jgi:hypothetical protein
MQEASEAKADRLRDDCTRTEAVELFWAIAKRIALQVKDLREVQQLINARWGRAPRLPKW